MQRILANLLVPPESIHVASGGNAALQALLEKAPAVVFLDLEMPDLDGRLVCRKMLEIEPMLVIIIMTAHDDDPRVREMLAMGAAGRIEKPVRADAVKRVLETVSTREAALDRIPPNRG